MMESTDLGLMKMAIGCRAAICRRLMAFPLTSKMQCFPFSATWRTDATDVPYRLSLYWPASMNKCIWRRENKIVNWRWSNFLTFSISKHQSKPNWKRIKTEERIAKLPIPNCRINAESQVSQNDHRIDLPNDHSTMVFSSASQSLITSNRSNTSARSANWSQIHNEPINQSIPDWVVNQSNAWSANRSLILMSQSTNQFRIE